MQYSLLIAGITLAVAGLAMAYKRMAGLQDPQDPTQAGLGLGLGLRNLTSPFHLGALLPGSKSKAAGVRAARRAIARAPLPVPPAAEAVPETAPGYLVVPLAMNTKAPTPVGYRARSSTGPGLNVKSAMVPRLAPPRSVHVPRRLQAASVRRPVARGGAAVDAPRATGRAQPAPSVVPSVVVATRAGHALARTRVPPVPLGARRRLRPPLDRGTSVVVAAHQSKARAPVRPWAASALTGPPVYRRRGAPTRAPPTPTGPRAASVFGTQKLKLWVGPPAAAAVARRGPRPEGVRGPLVARSAPDPRRGTRRRAVAARLAVARRAPGPRGERHDRAWTARAPSASNAAVTPRLAAAYQFKVAAPAAAYQYATAGPASGRADSAKARRPPVPRGPPLHAARTTTEPGSPAAVPVARALSRFPRSPAAIPEAVPVAVPVAAWSATVDAATAVSRRRASPTGPVARTSGVPATSSAAPAPARRCPPPAAPRALSEKIKTRAAATPQVDATEAVARRRAPLQQQRVAVAAPPTRVAQVDAAEAVTRRLAVTMRLAQQQRRAAVAAAARTASHVQIHAPRRDPRSPPAPRAPSAAPVGPYSAATAPARRCPPPAAPRAYATRGLTLTQQVDAAAAVARRLPGPIAGAVVVSAAAAAARQEGNAHAVAAAAVARRLPGPIAGIVVAADAAREENAHAVAAVHPVARSAHPFHARALVTAAAAVGAAVVKATSMPVRAGARPTQVPVAAAPAASTARSRASRRAPRPVAPLARAAPPQGAGDAARSVSVAVAAARAVRCPASPPYAVAKGTPATNAVLAVLSRSARTAFTPYPSSPACGLTSREDIWEREHLLNPWHLWKIEEMLLRPGVQGEDGEEAFIEDPEQTAKDLGRTPAPRGMNSDEFDKVMTEYGYHQGLVATGSVRLQRHIEQVAEDRGVDFLEFLPKELGSVSTLRDKALTVRFYKCYFLSDETGPPASITMTYATVTLLEGRERKVAYGWRFIERPPRRPPA